MSDHILPPELRAYLQDPSVRYTRERKCTVCSCQYLTGEIPMYFRVYWPGKAIWCPEHLVASRSKKQITVTTQLKGKYESPALTKAFKWGAVYRRRECPDCNWELGQKTGRWSTIEVPIDGVTTADVTKCPRCGEGTKIIWKEPRHGRPSQLVIERARRRKLGTTPQWEARVRQLRDGSGSGEE